jgi:hypothetical protein
MERYADAWKEVAICRDRGIQVNPAFVKDLSSKMSAPVRK